MKTERNRYVDNLRIFCILLLFPFHAAMCFNSFTLASGKPEGFYVWLGPVEWCSHIVVAVYPWWMALLFVLAGISTRRALQKRSAADYAKEHVARLLVPLLDGLILVVPPQAYIGDVFNNGYSGGFFSHYRKFFTTLTDFSGNDGAFTPGHLWFILYLFIISMVFLPLTSRFAKRNPESGPGRIRLPAGMSLPALTAGGFLFLGIFSLVGRIGNKGLGEYSACFLLGFFVLSRAEVIEKISKKWAVLSIAWAALAALRCWMWAARFQGDLAWNIGYTAFEWIGILATLSLGSRFLNVDAKPLRYLSRAAFPLYYFHQTLLLIVAFVLSSHVARPAPFILLTTAASFALSLAAYELFRCFPISRFLFGIKK